MKWISTSTKMPNDDIRVLVAYRYYGLHYLQAIAIHVSRNSVPVPDLDTWEDEVDMYCGIAYMPEGWYEICQFSADYMVYHKMINSIPDYWQPLNYEGLPE